MQQPTIPFNTAPLVLWTKKFALPFLRLMDTSLQKISATDKGTLVLSVYKPQDDRSLVLLSMKKGESGISLSHARPVTLKQPNSFVQIARKYLQGRKVSYVYATLSPICVVIEFTAASPERLIEQPELQDGPNALILDLDAKPPRLILAKKFIGVPQRYKEECGTHFSTHDVFFETWCEWSDENTKTKKRASFLYPFVGYCPTPPKEEKQDSVVTPRDDLTAPPRETTQQVSDDTVKAPDNDIAAALEILPTHIRRATRTRLQFLERRLLRQKADLPTPDQIDRLKQQSEGLKTLLHLWPKDSLTWYVPPQFIEEFRLNAIYILKKGQKPSSLLTHVFREIDILERRTLELKKRILESQRSLTHFYNLVCSAAQAIEKEVENYCLEKHVDVLLNVQQKRKIIEIVIARKTIDPLCALCKILEIEIIESEQLHKLKKEKEHRLPYKQYTASSGQFIRVARTAADSETMLKLMPSNHYWLHVLSGEGSHVWLEKLKGEKKPTAAVLREAGVLAIHHSKHARTQSAEVQLANKADIEKKKNLPVGKVLVRRCETFMIRYDDEELKRIIEGKI